MQEIVESIEHVSNIVNEITGQATCKRRASTSFIRPHTYTPVTTSLRLPMQVEPSMFTGVGRSARPLGSKQGSRYRKFEREKDMTIVFVTARELMEGGFLVDDVETREQYGRVIFSCEAHALVKRAMQDMRATVIVEELHLVDQLSCKNRAS
jgi:hypothetical protein